MRLLFLILLSCCAAVSIVSVSVESVLAQGAPSKPLRVLAYNIGGNGRISVEHGEGELRQLGDFIIANQIDVALLSEMHNYPAYKNAAPSEKDEGPYLQQYLASKGYQMQLSHTPMTGRDGRKLFGQVILSRYAAVPGSFLDQPYPNDDTRWIPSVAIQSPLGTLRLLSIHTQYGTGTCRQLNYIDTYIKSLTPSNPRLLAGGDFNNFACGDTWRDMMGDYQAMCGYKIDHLIAPEKNDFKVVGCQTVIPGISDHPAIQTDLLLKDGLSYPNPLPKVLGTPATPTPSPAPPVRGDLNSDRVVNRADVALLVTKLNQDFCGYNLVGSCGIDIYDYNTLVQLMTRL